MQCMSRVSRVGTFVELIKRRRLQLAVHSYIYYELNDSIISDHQWQAWAEELKQLQAKYPNHTDMNDEYFKAWDGTTGYHLCKMPDLHGRATQLLRSRYEQS